MLRDPPPHTRVRASCARCKKREQQRFMDQDYGDAAEANKVIDTVAGLTEMFNAWRIESCQ